MSSSLQRILVVLIAIVTICVTLLIVLNIMRSDATSPEAMRAAAGSPSLFDHPIALPAFALTERSGRTVTLDDLKGKVWIAAFIFTHCPGPCPRITSAMAQLQDDLAARDDWERIRLVSISVDPARDTPERLRLYAGWAGADEANWLFLTGDRQALWDLIVKGFKQPVDENPENEAEPFVHSQKFVLVDAGGRIRGFYDAIDQRGVDGSIVPHERDRLVRDMNLLLQ